jgi:hypothetical protein
MPGPLVTAVGSVVQCSHGGTALAAVPYPRVVLSGQPAVLLTSPFNVAGCSFPPNAGGPCVTGMFTVGTVRVTATGSPLCIVGGMGTCVPTGTPLLAISAQPRVVAT